MSCMDMTKFKKLGLGTGLSLVPMDSSRKTIRLNRKRVMIRLSKKGHFNWSPSEISLKAVSHNGLYSLSVLEEHEGGGLLFESHEGQPYLHNGILCMRSFLKEGDIIDLDYNRLVVKKEGELVRESFCESLWPEDAVYLLQGETGTGKSTLAKRLHYEFGGEHLPFVQVNLSSFNEKLLESELFGHDKGAFTGAMREKRGAIELAGRGTLFVDEIDSLPMHLQVKLLLFLDNGEFYRVGGERSLKSRCRLIFASGRSLEDLVKKGAFRQDLFFRLHSGIFQEILPLRKNKSLLEKLLNNFEFEFGVTLAEPLKTFYRNYSWPGNIRQFKSHLKRKYYSQSEPCLLHYDEWDEKLLDLKVPSALNEGGDVHDIEPLKVVKERYCHQVFLKSHHSYDVASKQLGIAKSTLRRILAA